MKSGTVKPVRCAIYTRVSTDHGLEQDFNSLDAQHDAAQAYIRSQAHAGWTLLRARYDDGGYSGGSTERPALHFGPVASRANACLRRSAHRIILDPDRFEALLGDAKCHGSSFSIASPGQERAVRCRARFKVVS